MDEILHAPSAMALLGEPVERTWHTQVVVAGRPFPLMEDAYNGSLRAYLSAPFLKVLGPSSLGLRLPAFLFGLGGLLLTYFLLEKVAGARAAALAFLLSATHPSLVLLWRADLGSSCVRIPIQAGLLLALLRWGADPRPRRLAVPAFLAGLGLWNRLDFVWFLLACAAAGAVLKPEAAGRALSVRSAAWVVAGLALGAFPLLAVNVAKPLVTLKTLLVMRQAVEADGVTFWDRLWSLASTLKGSALIEFFRDGRSAHLFRPPSEPLPYFASSLFAEAAAGTAALWVAFWARGTLRPSPASLFFGAWVAAALGALAMTPVAREAHHFVVLMPLVQAFVAAAAEDLFGWSRGGTRRVWAARAVAGLLIASVFTQLAAVRFGLRWLEREGGRGFWSPAVSELASHLGGHPEAVPRFMDWGMLKLVTARHPGLLRGAVNPGGTRSSELYRGYGERGFWWPPGFLEAEMGRPGAVFVLHAPRCTMFRKARHLFFLTARRRRWEVERAAVFREWDGKSAIELWRVAGSRPGP